MAPQKKLGPYIGVTGFTWFGEKIPIGWLDGSARLLMIGVLVSLKTLRNQDDRNLFRFPRLTSIKDIFLPGVQLLNLVHYNTSEPASLAGQIAVLRGWIGNDCDGLQLNVCWPDMGELAKIRKYWPAARIVLQCGSAALERVHYRPGHLCHLLTAYLQEKLIDDVLIDPSGGRGQPLDVGVIQPLVQAIYERELPVEVGIAGGLSPTTLHTIEPLIRAYPKLSIDAEGGLRTPDDHLDEGLVNNYIRIATAMFAAAESAQERPVL